MTYEDVAHRLRQSDTAETGAGASEDWMRRAEFTLGLRFPADYRSYLRDFGWAQVGAWELFGLGPDVPPHLDLVVLTQSERTEVEPALLPTLLPVANDAGGNLICIDLRATDTAATSPVVFRDHETGQAAAESSGFVDWLSRIVDRA